MSFHCLSAAHYFHFNVNTEGRWESLTSPSLFTHQTHRAATLMFLVSHGYQCPARGRCWTSALSPHPEKYSTVCGAHIICRVSKLKVGYKSSDTPSLTSTPPIPPPHSDKQRLSSTTADTTFSLP